jgi:hypothetical protein
MNKFYDFLLRFGETSAKSQNEFLKRIYPGLYETTGETGVSAGPARSGVCLRRLETSEEKS